MKKYKVNRYTGGEDNAGNDLIQAIVRRQQNPEDIRKSIRCHAQKPIQYFSWQEKFSNHNWLAIQVKNTPAAPKTLLGLGELERNALEARLRK